MTQKIREIITTFANCNFTDLETYNQYLDNAIAEIKALMMSEGEIADCLMEIVCPKEMFSKKAQEGALDYAKSIHEEMMRRIG